MKNILTIIKKELKRFFTDKRMLLTLILPGLLIYVIYSFLGSGLTSFMTSKTDYEYNVYVLNQPEQLKVFDEVEGMPINVNEVNNNIEDIKEKIKNEEIDLLIIYEENFIEKVNNYNDFTTNAPVVEMYYNSVSTESYTIYEYYNQNLMAYESSIANKFDVNPSIDVNYDLATNEDLSISLIKMMFPFLIIVFLFSGCMAIAPESIAGEKERGTIATLLVTPIKRSELAIGKIVSLSIISLVSALSSFLGIMFSLPNLFQGMNMSVNMYGFIEYFLILLIILSTVLIFVVVLSLVSTIAKSIKEASTYATPLMVLSMLIGVMSMFSTQNPNNISFLIPIYNSVLCFGELFSLNISISHILITVFSNLAYVILGVFALAKMFNNENIMFNK